MVNEKPGTQLLGDRRAADQVAPLEDQGAQARLGQVAGVDQAVVAAADHDRVVRRVRRGWSWLMGGAVFLAGLNSGSRAVRAATVVVWWWSASSRRTRRARRGQVGADPAEADVALQDGGVHEAGGVADLGRRRRRTASTRRAAGARPSAAAGRRRGAAASQSAQSTTRPVVAQRDVPSTSSRRIASRPMNARSSSWTPRSIQPMPELLGRDPLVVGERQPAVVPLDVDRAAARPRCAASSAPPRRTAAGRAPRPASRTASRTSSGAVGGDGDLEAQVAGVAGARQGHRHRADLGWRVLEVGERVDLAASARRARHGSAAPARRASRSRRTRPRR